MNLQPWHAYDYRMFPKWDNIESDLFNMHPLSHGACDLFSYRSNGLSLEVGY
jgi:hypothetical protein